MNDSQTGKSAGPELPDRNPDSGDADRLRAAQDGDNDAFRELVQQYQRSVFACAWTILRNSADAADACQETFIRFHRNLAQCDPRRPLKPYLLTIAFNCAKNFRRDRDRARQELAGEETAVALQRVTDHRPSPERHVMTGEKHAAILQLVNNLPETLRDVCRLFYLTGCNCQEVAEILRMSETAVKVALHRARKRLLESGAREWRPI